MRSDVIYIYIITCPRCQVRYVGQTDRHLITCFKEHRDRSALPVVMHFADCGLMMKEEDVVILALKKCHTSIHVPIKHESCMSVCLCFCLCFHVFRTHQKSQLHKILAQGVIWANLKHDEVRI